MYLLCTHFYVLIIIIIIKFVLSFYDFLQGESDEKSKTSPWTCIAKYKLMVEEELAKLEG